MPQLPPPFKRPGISLSTGETKAWKDVSVYSLRPGDIVRGKGAVDFVSDASGGVKVLWQNGSFTHYDEGDIVHAFVRV